MSEKIMTFKEYEDGAKLLDDTYVACKNEVGIITHYEGFNTGQKLGKWFAEVAE
jgi:hypothetical protein